MKTSNKINYNGKMVNTTSKKRFWNVMDKVVAILPLGVLVAINHETYFATSEQVAYNILGLGGLGAFIFLIISKKGQLLKGAWGFIAFTGICWLLRFILQELFSISLCATIGMVVSTLWTKPLKEKWANLDSEVEKAVVTSQVNASANKEVINELASLKEVSGRV